MNLKRPHELLDIAGYEQKRDKTGATLVFNTMECRFVACRAGLREASILKF